MKKLIIQRKPTTNLASKNLHPILKRIYENRGIADPQELDRSLKALLPYHSLKDINKAAELLHHHIKQKNRILIIGDFDADGATSSALAMGALKAFGATEINYLVPNRFEYGYGLTPEIVEVALQWQPNLIITVDNGISSIDGVNAAKENGIQVLITDHHLPGRELPDAAAIVNPNQQGDEFDSKNLAGVGVIFYVMSALRKYLREKNWFKENNSLEPNMAEFLDLVALGTVADVVPLDKNNRILVHQGLQRIRANLCRPGIKALIEVAKRNSAKITASDLGFALGPRLNAAGRLDDMSVGIECLLSEDLAKAQELAQQLDDLNHERRAIETDMKQQAFKELAKLQLDKKHQQLPVGLCIYDENWHQGVIGILASRIKDQYHRPVIAFAPGDNNLLKGSARSVKGLHIRDALDAVATKHPDLITKFGGHAMAAGLSLQTKHLDAFSQAFDEQVRIHLDAANLRHEIYSDGELQAEDFSLDLAQALQDAGPWGQGFPEPIFDNDFEIVSQRIVGANHLKLVLKLANDQMIDAIAFNVNTDEWPNHRCQNIHAAYKLDINEYRGMCSAQLIIEYLTVSNRKL